MTWIWREVFILIPSLPCCETCTDSTDHSVLLLYPQVIQQTLRNVDLIPFVKHTTISRVKKQPVLLYRPPL